MMGEDDEVMMVAPTEDHSSNHKKMMTNMMKARDSSAIKLYRSRWFQLGMIVLLQMSNAMIWISFAPIIQVSREFFDCNSFLVDLQSLIFMMMSVPFGFTGTFLLNSRGLRYGVVFAAIFNAVGAGVRFIGAYPSSPDARLAVVSIGQAIAAFAQPIFLDSPTLLAATWFGELERAKANTVASVANPIGIAVGSLVSGLLVITTDDMQWMLLINAVFAGVILVLTAVFFKDRPPTPPSRSAATTHFSFVDGLKELRGNVPYWILLVCFGIGIALISVLATVFAQITEGNGYTSDDAAFMSLAMVGVGLVGAGISGTIVDKTHAFLPMFKGCFFGVIVGLVWFHLANTPDNIVSLVLATAVIGFFAFAALPVGLELCVETTFPVNEGLSAGLIWIVAQVFSLILLVSTTPLRGDKRFYNGTEVFDPAYNTEGVTASPLPEGIDVYYDHTNTTLTYIIVTAVATLLILFMKTDYKRLNSEAASSSSNGDSDMDTDVDMDMGMGIDNDYNTDEMHTHTTTAHKLKGVGGFISDNNNENDNENDNGITNNVNVSNRNDGVGLREPLSPTVSSDDHRDPATQVVSL